MNLKEVIIDTVKEVVQTFITELKKMFKNSIDNISIDPECIDFYIKVQKVLSSERVVDKSNPEVSNVMDIILLEYRKKVDPNILAPIAKKRSADLSDKNAYKKETIATAAAKGPAAAAAAAAKKDGWFRGGDGGAAAAGIQEGGLFGFGNKNTPAPPAQQLPPEPRLPDTHRIILEPQVLPQIKLPRIKLMEDETYNRAVNAVATPIKSGIKTVTCAACGVRGIYLTVRKKIISMFEGNTNSILETLFSIESPVYTIVKEHITGILEELEKPMVQNFAAIMFDVSNKKLVVRKNNPYILGFLSTDLFIKEKGFAARIKAAEKLRAENEAKFRLSLQTDIDNRVAAAKKAEEEKAAAEKKKRRQCGGGGARRRRGRAQARTYKWRRVGARVKRPRKKTLRIK